MMQQMRENTKWIMLITALAFVALMVFEWGMDMSGQSAGAMTGGELGSVNGSAITYNEYTQVYRNLYEQRQQQGEAISTSQNREIENQAFEELVTDRLIQQELRRRGIAVTEDEIRQAARYAPPPEFRSNQAFLTDGQFDLDKYHQFLSSASADPQLLIGLEQYYRRVIPRNKLFQQVAASVVVTDAELWRMYKEQTETATMRYVAMNPQRMVSDAEVTIEDRDVTAYYNENRENFERPAQATVRLVTVDKRPTAADSAASLEAARELRAEILGGADFAEVAARVSEDPGSAERGGSLGTIRRGQMVAPFEDAVWSAPIGRVTAPVATRFGYHLIRVDERTDETATASHILLPVERTIESEDNMLARVDSLEAMVERMSLDAAAEELGLTVRETQLTPVVPNVPGVGPVDEGLEWVFEERAAVGEISPIFETDQAFYLFDLVDREDRRVLTLDEARSSIETILRTERKRDRTRDMGRELVDRIAGGASLDEAAGAPGLGLQVAETEPFTRLGFVPGVGGGNAAIGAAFGLDIGEVSELLETREGFFLVQPTDRTSADREAWEAQKDQQRMQAVNALQGQRLDQFMRALREEADVVDQRQEVLRAQPAA